MLARNKAFYKQNLPRILFSVAQYGDELREIIEQNKMRRSKDTAQTKGEANVGHDEKCKIKCHSEPENLEKLTSQVVKNELCV